MGHFCEDPSSWRHQDSLQQNVKLERNRVVKPYDGAESWVLDPHQGEGAFREIVLGKAEFGFREAQAEMERVENE